MKIYLNNILLGLFLVSSPLTGSMSMVGQTNDITVVPQQQTREISREIPNKPPEKSKKQKQADIIIEVANNYDIKPIDMLAMWHNESLAGDELVGDNGCSHGHFHINTCYYANPSAKPVIGDLRTEAEWVAKTLIGHGYFDNRELAIAKYNKPAGGNWAYYERIQERKQYVIHYTD